ncbi:MAG: hypothetical protein WDN49_02350 [Acetobacteraceae bacterium]
MVAATPAPAGPALPIYFDSVIVVSDADPRRLDPVRAPGAPEAPEPMRKLMREIQALSAVVARVFDTTLDVRRQLFDELRITARLGLCGGTYSIALAEDNLDEIKGHVAAEFPTVRDALWRRNLGYVGWTLLWAMPGAALFVAVQLGWQGLAPPQADASWPPWLAAAFALFWIPLGTAVGIFLEFSYSMDREIAFDDLLKINPGRWKPLQRLVNTLVTAGIFAGIMSIGAIQIGVLSVLLNDFSSKRPLLSLAVGFVSGFSFPYVRDLIYKFKPVQK